MFHVRNCGSWANPQQFELLGEVQISDEETWAHIAVTDNELFIRELNGLAAYRWRPVQD